MGGPKSCPNDLKLQSGFGKKVDPVFGVEFVTLAEGLLSHLIREWPEEADAGFHPMTEMLKRTLLEL